MKQEGCSYAKTEMAIISAYAKPEIPPSCYNDIKHIVSCTLLEVNPKEIIKAFVSKSILGSIIPLEDVHHLQLESFITKYQATKSTELLEEIHESLIPYFESFIEFTSKKAGKGVMCCDSSDLKFKWLDYFGIWHPNMQVAYKKVNDHNVLEIEGIEGEGEFTYCPKYRCEIDVDGVCNMGDCPFYEAYDDGFSVEHRCYFDI